MLIIFSIYANNILHTMQNQIWFIKTHKFNIFTSRKNRKNERKKHVKKIELRTHTTHTTTTHLHTHLHTHLTDMSLEIGTDVQCHPQRLWFWTQRATASRTAASWDRCRSGKASRRPARWRTHAPNRTWAGGAATSAWQHVSIVHREVAA